MRRKLPLWAPREPNDTCPSIDDMQKTLRARADELVEMAETLRSHADELEDLRSANVALRDWGKDCISNAESEIDERDGVIRELRGES